MKTVTGLSAARMDLVMTQGLAAQLGFKLQKYNYAKGCPEPVDLTGKQISFRAYDPRSMKIEAGMQMTTAEGKKYAGTVELDADEKGEFFLAGRQSGTGGLREQSVKASRRANIEILQRQAAPPTVKQHMAAIRMLFSWLTEKGVLAMNPAREVKTERFSRTEGKTPAFVDGEVQKLLDAIETSTHTGLRDRALLGVLAYTIRLTHSGRPASQIFWKMTALKPLNESSATPTAGPRNSMTAAARRSFWRTWRGFGIKAPYDERTGFCVEGVIAKAHRK
ncbi:MAG TPA: hypothetical protein VNY04_09110 [Chthoniobacterales bacterium]|nr:hypothetical protein [Chthoniobacterales bacterium]